MQLKGVLNLCGIRIMIPLDDSKNGPLESSQKERLAASEVDFVVYLRDLCLGGGI